MSTQDFISDRVNPSSHFKSSSEVALSHDIVNKLKRINVFFLVNVISLQPREM